MCWDEIFGYGLVISAFVFAMVMMIINATKG